MSNPVPIRPNDVKAAAMAALALTDMENEKCMVPIRHAAGALILHELAKRILNDEVIIRRNPALEPPQQQPQPVQPPEEPLDIE